MEVDSKKLFREALKSEEFDADMRKQDPIGYYKPSFLENTINKKLYGLAYYGWLLGKGTFDRSNYLKD